MKQQKINKIKIGSHTGICVFGGGESHYRRGPRVLRAGVSIAIVRNESALFVLSQPVRPATVFLSFLIWFVFLFLFLTYRTLASLSISFSLSVQPPRSRTNFRPTHKIECHLIFVVVVVIVVGVGHVYFMGGRSLNVWWGGLYYILFYF